MVWHLGFLLGLLWWVWHPTAHQQIVIITHTTLYIGTHTLCSTANTVTFCTPLAACMLYLNLHPHGVYVTAPFGLLITWPLWSCLCNHLKHLIRQVIKGFLYWLVRILMVSMPLWESCRYQCSLQCTHRKIWPGFWTSNLKTSVSM